MHHRQREAGEGEQVPDASLRVGYEEKMGGLFQPSFDGLAVEAIFLWR